MRELVPVAPLIDTDLVLVVHPSVPAKTLSELLALARAKPGTLNYGSSGPGSNYHMRGQWDGIASIEDLLNFYAKLPNPDKQFTVMPGISHASFQQKNYMLVYHILASFFAQPAPIFRG